MTMKLTFELQVDAICRKADKHIYFFYQKLWVFYETFMRMFYYFFI